MPPTPFIGISLLIHSCVVLLHKIFHWMPRKRIVHKKATRATRFLSLFIVMVVSLFVVLSAVIVIYISIEDKHSIFKIISRLIF